MEFIRFHASISGRPVFSISRRWRAAAVAVAIATAGVGVASPPANAADEVPSRLAEFYTQTVTWAPCDSAQPEPLCATLTVPIDYRAPERGRMAVTMSRLPAADQARRAGVLLLNPGGPGGSGIDLPLVLRDRAVAERYDLIGFDPRGFGRSTPVACEVPESVGDLTSRPSDAEFAVWVAAARAAEEGCERSAGGLRPYINTPNTARDMDVMRAVLGEKKINYLGFSYGTYLGAVYGSLFPTRLNRSVLDSSVNPEGLWRESFKADAPAARENVDEWAAWVGRRDRTFGLGASGAAVFAESERLAAKLHERPIVVPDAGITLDRTTYDLLLGSLTRYRQLWEFTTLLVDVLGDVADGVIPPDSPELADAARALLALRSLGIAPTETPIGFYSTVMCEAEWPTDLETYYADMRVFRERYPFGAGVAVAATNLCAFRNFTPPDRVTRLTRKYPIGLVVQAEADIQTPYAGGPVMARTLNEPLVSVADDGSHGQYLYNACVQAIVDRYLIDGVVPGTRVTCEGAPRPDVPEDSASAGSALAPLARPSLARNVEQLIQNESIKKVVLPVR